MEKPALQKEGMVPVTVELPFDVHDQIRKKAEAFGTDFQTAVATLLRIGLKAQAAAESELSRHVGKLLDEVPSEDAGTIDKIGELIFAR